MSKKILVPEDISPSFFKRYSRVFTIALIGLLGVVALVVGVKYIPHAQLPTFLGERDTDEKVPYDTKVLTMRLTTQIDPASLSQEMVTLSPTVKGHADLGSDKRTLSYTLQEPLTIGEVYELRVSSTSKKLDGTLLGKDEVMTFLALPGAKAMAIFPTGSLDTLSQNITVVFNTPMVPLTNLKERDTLPCPLTITPHIDGRCIWTNTSILEYIPTHPLQGATHYELQVGDKKGLLRTLGSTLTGDIMTTPLRISVSDSFSPLSGISLVSNFPLSLENLIGALELTSSGTMMGVGVTPQTTESGTLSETRFTIMPKDQKFLYGTDYMLRVRTSLKPKYGTEALKEELIKSLHTNYFLTSIEPYQNVFGTSGVRVDSKNFNTTNIDSPSVTIPNPLPSEGLFFLAHFDQEHALDSSILTFRSKSDNTTIPFDIVYGKEYKYDKKGTIIGGVDDKTTFKITPKVSLKKDSDYEIVTLRKADGAMPSDIRVMFHTAPGFVLSDFSLISSTEGCLYTNNKFANPSDDIVSSGARIVTRPASRIPTVHEDYGHITWSANGQTSKTEYTCPQISGKYVYVVDLRLNPLLAYKIDFLPTLLDEYGQHVSRLVSFSVKTGPIDPKDQYLYSSAAGGQTQVIPSSLPIILGLISANIDSAHIEVCEMDQEGYIAFRGQEQTSPYPLPPNCTKKTDKKIAIKNRYWTLTPTKLDLEKDILGHAFTTPYIYIRGSVEGYTSGDAQKYFSHTFIRSNLSLTLEDSSNKRILFASSYDAKTLPPDLKFEAYRSVQEYPGSMHYEKITNPPISYNSAKKLYEITDTGAAIDILIAKNAAYFGVLSLGQDQTSNYDFKYISGQDASNQDYLYIYPDRPLYQLSDTVYFKGVLRSYHFDGYHPTQVKKGKLKVLGGAGTVSGEATLAEMDMTLDENSNFHGEFSLPKSAPLGRYTFEFSAYAPDGTLERTIYNNGEFYIEAYKKPVFKVTTTLPKPDAMVGGAVDIEGHSEYYFGGALAGAEYQYSVLAQNYYFNPRDYSDYHFSRGSTYRDCLYWGACDYHDTLMTSGTGVLSGRGDARVHYDYAKQDTPGEQIYTYSLEVTDPDTSKTVHQRVSQIVHATDAYVGVLAPYWNGGSSGVKVDAIVLDYASKGLAGKTVGLELVKRDWKNVKKEGVDGVFYNEGMVEETIIEKIEEKTDIQGGLSHTFLSATGGEYEIRATYTGSNGVPFISSVYAYVSGNDEQYWYEGNNAIADITPDKTLLSVGDRAGFTLKTPIVSGKMLVSIEKDDGILDAYIQDITSTTSRIEFDVPDSYIPNVYVKVFALGQNPGEKLPIYKRALSVIKVLPDPKKLSVTVAAEKQKYLPGEAVKIKVHVQDSKGKPIEGANGSLSVVDESLLALAGNPEKNPFAYFYDMKRYLGVLTYTSLLNLVAKLEVKDTSLGEKGGAGDGQKGGLSKKKRGVFKDTAFWQSDFKTDRDGNYTLTTPALPDNLTTWVIEALLNTKKSEVGVGLTHIQTSKNVLINDNLPRFLGTADAVTIAPVIFNKTDRDATFDISVEASNVTLKNTKQSVDIQKGESLSVPFDLVVDGIEKIRHISPQASKITIKAVSRATGDQDTIEMTLPIIETTTREMVVTAGRADPLQDEQIDLSPAMRNNGGSLAIHYAGTLLPGLLSGLDFLTNYPYGCIEQQLATIMPEVYIKSLYDAIGMPYDLSTKTVKKYISKNEGYHDVSLKSVITEVVESVPSYQMYDGGFAYWKDSQNSYLPLTLSVVSRLQDLSRLGFVVAPGVLPGASKYIKNTFYTNTRPYCTMTDCSYSFPERLDMIAGVLDATPDDYDAYKMYQVLVDDMKKKQNSENKDTSANMSQNSVELALSHAHLLKRLSGLLAVSEKERGSLLREASDRVKKIGSENIVMNPRGAFIGRSESNTRLTNTLLFVEGVTELGGTLLTEDRPLLDQMSRWIMSEKKSDGSWGSTLDTTHVIRAITAIERTTGDIAHLDLESTLSLDAQVLEKQRIGSGNKLETFSKSLTLEALKDTSHIRFEKTGTGSIYYDIALEYALRASGQSARDEGFFLESSYYDYAEYKAIDTAKKEEWKRYMAADIEYSDLKYPKDVPAYLHPIDSLKIGQLVMVYNRMILAEPRDQVAFEGFIPAGAELVNPDLKTESQDIRDDTIPALFDHEEWQDDRYFATTSTLDAGIYSFGYIVRPTHAGTYELRPSRLSEFYHPEVFGRTAGRAMHIEK